MKTKKYLYGKFYFTAYYKPVGHGYEVGMTYGKKTIFVGNFIHKEEATTWFAKMNLECKHFVNKYWINDNVSTTWYCSFFKNHLYKTYYSFLDKLFTEYKHSYNKAFKKDFKNYKNLKKHWHLDDAPVFKIKAA
jgi:hypothetical protein